MLSEWREASGNFYWNRASNLDYVISFSDIFTESVRKSEYLSRFINNADNENKLIVSAFRFVLDWISDVPTIELEEKYQRGAGGLRKDALTLVWILGVIEKVLGLYKDNYPEIINAVEDLSKLREQLRYGVSAEKLFIASSFKIDREYVSRLYNLGVRSAENLRGLDYSTLLTVLPERVARQVYRLIETNNEKDIVEPKLTEINFTESIVFTGNKQKTLKEVLILGKSVYLQPTLYGYFQKLWWNQLSGSAWISKNKLGPGDNQAKYISKIRNILKKKDVDIKIISDGAGSYKILLPDAKNDSHIVREKN
jgi:hypothetical protein